MSQKTYDSQTAKFIATVIQNLPPDLTATAMQEWIERPKDLQEVLRSALGSVSSDFPIWKTITVGGMSRDELLAAFEAKGFKASNWAKGMMTKPEFVITPEPRKIDLVLATVGDLGFPKGDTTREIWKRIKELGSLCPPDLGPHLRLAYADQPDGEYIWVAMEQIVASGGCPRVFEVYRAGGERWLNGFVARPGAGWGPCGRVAFVRPRK